jgi:hypothetical protein
MSQIVRRALGLLGRRGAAVVVSLALLLEGCGAAVCPVQRFSDPTRALASYQSMRSYARVVRADARVDRRDAGGRVRGSVLMLLERPDRVRFDAMTQLGPAAVLTSDGTTFALTDLRENRFYVGPACPANIERLLGIPLSGQDALAILTGETPRIEAAEETLQCAEGSYRVELRAADGTTQHLGLEVRQADVAAPPEQQRMRLRSSELREPGGALVWRVSWDDYRFVPDPESRTTPPQGIAMPYRIRFEHPGRGIDTLIRFESIDMNAPAPSDAFVQEARGGLEIEMVECE